MPGFKGFALRVLAFGPLLAMVMGLNYYVDPANVFHAGDYESSVVDLLLHGSNVDDYRTGDERLLQKLYIERMASGHEIAVFGSSRMMQLRAMVFPGRSFFNHSVSGGTLRDMISIDGLLRASERRASTVVIGLDPWSFTPTDEDGLVHSLWQEYRDAAAAIGLSDSVSRPLIPRAELGELFSLRSFQSAVSQLIAANGKVARAAAVPTRLDEGPTAVKRSDGSLGYGAELRLRTPEAARQDAEQFVRRSPYAANAFQPPDPGLVRIFQAWLAALRRDGVTVILWRSPLHPLSYRELEGDALKRRGMAEIEALCRSVADQQQVTLIGSFNPADHGLTEADFYDGFHPKAEAVARLARVMPWNF